MTLLYHFTAKQHLQLIEASGVLRVTESNASFTERHKAPDCVWLTTSPLPRTISGSLSGSRLDKSEVRFTVDVPHDELWSWRMFTSKYDVDPHWRRTLERLDPGWRTWRMIFRDVPKSEWVSIGVAD